MNLEILASSFLLCREVFQAPRLNLTGEYS